MHVTAGMAETLDYRRSPLPIRDELVGAHRRACPKTLREQSASRRTMSGARRPSAPSARTYGLPGVYANSSRILVV